ncbi:hypothetical protein [Jiulongibacter sediminis]|uniref:Lipocalin-like domain-containing protein n=1 Tax=Jiulongibacter sediminis TaxID=1605367 RepID=A0A0P7C099_9BACT|nr:hypothetical protein [Jiulongibacter sediminis]KPM47390.1 hypothetical protein AFM12_14645 [Jiulongibacter sediminis]TBX22970.1 hypothetical protein TK44_14655 [Jiulongibacter sediminis]
MKKNISLFSVCALLISVILISSCEKAEPEPPLSDQITGQYEVDYYLVGSTLVSLPVTVDGITATAKINISRVSDTDAKVVFTFIQTASSFGLSDESTSTVPSVSLSKSSSGEIMGADASGNSITHKNGEVEVILKSNDPSKTLTIHANTGS